VRMIIAVIQPTRLQVVREALARIGVQRLTICDAQGFARQKGHTETYRGLEYKTHLLRKVTLEIAVNDDFLDRTLQTLERAAKSGSGGNIGDGKIFVLPLDEAICIDSGLRGQEAV
jgi:nitrogen regulatory protein P-II 2